MEVSNKLQQGMLFVRENYNPEHGVDETTTTSINKSKNYKNLLNKNNNKKIHKKQETPF